MSRMLRGRSRVRRPDVESAAQAGLPVACIAAKQVSMPSPTMTISLACASRTTPPRHGPSIALRGLTAALPFPSGAR